MHTQIVIYIIVFSIPLVFYCSKRQQHCYEWNNKFVRLKQQIKMLQKCFGTNSVFCQDRKHFQGKKTFILCLFSLKEHISFPLSKTKKNIVLCSMKFVVLKENENGFVLLFNCFQQNTFFFFVVFSVSMAASTFQNIVASYLCCLIAGFNGSVDISKYGCKLSVSKAIVGNANQLPIWLEIAHKTNQATILGMNKNTRIVIPPISI